MVEGTVLKKSRKNMPKFFFFINCFLLFSIYSLFAVSDESKYVNFIDYNYSIDDIKSHQFDTIYIAAASPTIEHIGSLGAHSFVVLANGEDLNSAIALNYYAYHESQSKLEKIVNGATIGLNGYTDVRKFNELAERYNIGQNRTLFLYKTNIASEKIDNLIDIFYEYSKGDLKYQFFNYNCSSFLGDVFSTLLNSEEKSYFFPHSIMPARLISLFKKYNLIVDEFIISPPLVKLHYSNTKLNKNQILDRYYFFKVFNREVNIDDGFAPFEVTVDDFKSNTIFSEKVSKIGVGVYNNNFSFRFSLFNNDITEQRQSAICLYSFKFMDASFSYENKLNIEKLTILEKSSYTKVNLLKVIPSDYVAVKYNTNNSNIDILGGLGVSFGTINTMFSLIPTLETNLANLELSLRLSSKLLINFDKSYCLLNFDYPIYNEQSFSNKDLSLLLAYQVDDKLLAQASYNIINNSYKIYFDLFLYPLIR